MDEPKTERVFIDFRGRILEVTEIDVTGHGETERIVLKCNPVEERPPVK